MTIIHPETTARLRRLYHHIANGGNLNKRDLSFIVSICEMLSDKYNSDECIIGRVDMRCASDALVIDELPEAFVTKMHKSKRVRITEVN